jgi:tetratricopeptide (TPR) repeat protein
VEEHYKNVFKLQTSQWIGDIECLIKLFQGLMAKEKYQSATGEEKAAALAEAEKVFTDLSACASDVALKIFALHCKGWAEIQNNKPEEALATYDRILGIDSTNALALNNSALLYEASNSPLHAHTRYEKILAKNDIPYIRLANAEALTKLDRKEEAAKEIRHVREGTDYEIKKEAYETRIRKIPSAAIVPSSVTSVDPATSLSMIAIQVNEGRRSEALRNLEALEKRSDVATLSPENLAIMRELYLKVGAEEQADDVNKRAALQGVRLQSNTTALSRAIRTN